jgi:hypothetical protein
MGINGLESVINEMDVQDRYRVAFRDAFKDIIFESKFNSDGIAYSKIHNLRLIIEQKHKYNFNNIIERAKVISQIISYLKTIHETDPTIMPKVAVVGDENETFVIPVKDIINYISINEYDWSLPPSSMYKDTTLINDLCEDKLLKELYIYNPKNEFDGIINKIKQISKGVLVPRTLTHKNIDKVFQYFENKVTLKRLGKKINPNDSVNLFAHIMLHPDSVMLNEKTKQLFTGMFKEPVSVSDVNAYKSFTSEYSRTYTPKQKHAFTAILDRLIEDTTRRKQGEFFTPTIWVDKAHEYIASVYGEDWKEKYVVWDPAWGTGNLTRDYKFKELYASTLNQSDIDTANQMGYNLEAVKFQFDFLNDDYDFLPKGLRNAIESGKDIIVLMNPPYGSVNDFKNIKNDGGKSKNDIEDTIVKKQMNDEKLGLCVKNLYSQFIYRITRMGKINIGVFSPPLMYSGIDFKIFRDKVLSEYDFEGGFIMDSAQFADVKSWGLTFSVLSNKK